MSPSGSQRHSFASASRSHRHSPDARTRLPLPFPKSNTDGKVTLDEGEEEKVEEGMGRNAHYGKRDSRDGNVGVGVGLQSRRSVNFSFGTDLGVGGIESELSQVVVGEEGAVEGEGTKIGEEAV